MGLLSPKKLHTDVTKGEFRNLYYFFGPEDYRISEATKYIAQQFLPDRQLATNFLRLDGRKTRCADLIAELSVFPMLGERQVFAVSSFQSYKPTEIERVLKLLEPADPVRIVILNSPSDKTPKKNSAFFKKINSVAECVEFHRLDSESAAVQVTSKLSKAGLEIESRARDLLVGLLAGNRGALDSEVAKLIDYVEPGGTVTVADIEKIAAGYEAFTVFQLGGEIARGDRLRALQLVKRLLREGGTPTGILYFLGQHFVSLYLIKAGKSLESNRRWLEREFRPQAAGFELSQLERAIQLIAQADSDLRHKRTPPELVLDQLVLQMLTPQGQRA
jgi:DNA polymerase III delta subunit